MQCHRYLQNCQHLKLIYHRHHHYDVWLQCAGRAMRNPHRFLSINSRACTHTSTQEQTHKYTRVHTPSTQACTHQVHKSIPEEVAVFYRLRFLFSALPCWRNTSILYSFALNNFLYFYLYSACYWTMFIIEYQGVKLLCDVESFNRSLKYWYLLRSVFRCDSISSTYTVSW